MLSQAQGAEYDKTYRYAAHRALEGGGARRRNSEHSRRLKQSCRFISISPTLTNSESSHRSPLFAGISQLVSATFKVSRGGEIFGEGENAQFVYKLVTGSVRVCKTLTDGQRHISCFHVPGDVFGLERTATHRMGAEALEASQVLMFRRSQVERLIASDLDAAHQMLGIFISSLSSVTPSTVALIQHDDLRALDAAFPRPGDILWRDTLMLRYFASGPTGWAVAKRPRGSRPPYASFSSGCEP